MGQAGQTGQQQIPINLTPQMVNQGAPPSLTLQVALKNAATGDVVYIQQPPICVDFGCLLSESGPMEKSAFLEHWKSLPAENESQFDLTSVTTTDEEGVKAKLAAKNVFFLTARQVAGATKAYFSCSVQPSNAPLLAEITFQQGLQGLKLCVKTQQKVLSGFFHEAVASALSS